MKPRNPETQNSSLLTPHPLRILGIDPGLRVTGFGILDKSGEKLKYVVSGRIKTAGGELGPRLKAILDGVNEVITRYQPQEVAVEKVFVSANPQSTLLLGEARGAAICAVVEKNLPLSEYTALQVKQAVVGTGHAKKEQVQEMVSRLLRLTGNPGLDAADALACAICHAHAGFGKLAATGYRIKKGRLV